jgi:valyl-tRNA synthetase
VVDVATVAFDDFDYARALERTEAFFWRYCDDYIELVKGRAYGAARGAAPGGHGAARGAAPGGHGAARGAAPGGHGAHGVPDRSTVSARRALRLGLSALQRLLAPTLAFTAEEVWSWWQPGSIHRAPWPDAAELRLAAGDGDPAVFSATATVLGEVRKAKTEAKRSLRTTAERVVVADADDRLALLTSARFDLLSAGNIVDLELVPADAARVEVVLASAEA